MPTTKSEKVKLTNSQKVQRCLERNYKQYKLNVRKEQFAEWEMLAEAKGKSVRATIIEVMENAIEDSKRGKEEDR